MTGNNITNRTAGIGITILAYVVALISGIYAARIQGAVHPLVQIAIADLAATCVIFIFSMIFNNSSMYDPYWSVKPAVIAVFYLFVYYPGAVPMRQLLLAAAVMIYSIRLTANFYRQWPGLQHEDWRYRDFRKQFPKLYWVVSFLGIHFFPTLMVYLGCLPLFPAMAAGQAAFGVLDGVGLVVIIGGALLAFIADEQMITFRKGPSHKGKVMMSGLWKHSRHPNYLGEILNWWGIFLIGLASGVSFWWTGIGAFLITLMFIFVSIPLMDKHAIDREGFTDYKKSTPALLPFRF
jgi:steroid 5-alpha reductase family enzyme